MILDSTTRRLEILLGEAKTTSDCDVTACYATTDSASIFTVATAQATSNGTTPAIVVNPPAFGQQIQVNEVRLHNNDTVAHTVTLRLNDTGGPTVTVLMQQIIAAGGDFLYTPEAGAPVAGGGGGGSGTVTSIATSGGIHGGPITTSGTLTVDWNGGTVTALGAGLSLITGTLSATGGGGTNIWNAGTVTTVDGGLILAAGTLSARAAGWDGPITATGSTQATAYPITKAASYFATVAAGTGGVLPATPTVGDRYEAINDGANTLAIYPPSGATIDGGATNAAVLVLAGGNARFFASTSTTWVSR